MRPRALQVVIAIPLVVGYAWLLLHLREVGAAIAVDPKLRSYAGLPTESNVAPIRPTGAMCFRRWLRLSGTNDGPAEFGGTIRNSGRSYIHRVKVSARGYDRRGRLVESVAAECRPCILAPGGLAQFCGTFSDGSRILRFDVNISAEAVGGPM